MADRTTRCTMCGDVFKAGLETRKDPARLCEQCAVIKSAHPTIFEWAKKVARNKLHLFKERQYEED